MQICTCKAIYALTPKVGHDVLQPALNALYEGEASTSEALQGTLHSTNRERMQGLLIDLGLCKQHAVVERVSGIWIPYSTVTQMHTGSRTAVDLQ